MNRLRGLQAAPIGFPYNYPAEPMTGVIRSCLPGPVFVSPWTELFPVPILMMNIPTYHRGVSNAQKKFPYSLHDNPYTRKVIWQLQKGLATMGCLETGDSEKGEKFGSLRIITSYRKDVD
eukprot:197039-Heterocapsa_arctica.AAC.1